ncbi:hypothetical protein P10VF_160 [Rhizobium phage vB_RleM_P10VF]|uniref:Uncharacterized protein n=1 Tax=Rhizobium phage vB_RleM_P10VF TaxID=1527770 RepID=A0A076YIU8_9CAUD|nr:hypothetical protein P10VF_160 [Rhizobium phage vB_RleM_P10VF]AIK68373.1 hypothetical protein P10VF_160 [Rhizobium phage vB_RleM_P10VF]
MTFRELLAMQYKHKVMVDNIVYQKERLRSMEPGPGAWKRQKQHIENLEREFDEFLDTEI